MNTLENQSLLAEAIFEITQFVIEKNLREYYTDSRELFNDVYTCALKCISRYSDEDDQTIMDAAYEYALSYFESIGKL